MRRLPTMLASASAAALTTLAVTVAVPAIADDAPDARGEDEVVACLSEHGLDAVPAGAALKEWLGARLERGDATAKRALHACVPEKRIVNAGPTEQELRSCLADHGVQPPAGDGRVLKQWILEHGDDAANRDALKACHVGPVGKPGDGAGGPCGKEDGVRTAVPVDRAKKPAALPPVSDGD
jgi:hypothetical protein